MSTADRSPVTLLPSSLHDPTTRLRVAVAVVALLALVVRLVGLGQRIAHQDEARVAYWAYRYMETGVYWYRPIVHGPFITLVNGAVFDLFGASDFTMRLVAAVVGGLLPLSALLFRHRLRESEAVALSLLLAANPLLLYYSRFYRNDLLLAGFMLVAFGCFVRAYDDQRPAFLYLGAAFFALAFTTKENALLYPVAWAGAAVMVYDYRLVVGRANYRDPLGAAADWGRERARTLRPWLTDVVLSAALFLVIFVFFYAPRGEAARAEPTLGATLADPTLLPDLVGEATLGSWEAFLGQWGTGNESSYLSAVEAFLPVLGTGAVVLLTFAALGFVVDRYTGERPRPVVAFTAFWGLFSAIGYPIAVDNPFPWEPVHIVAPLVVPAAVGIGLVWRLGRESYEDDDSLAAGLAALVLLAAAAQVGVTAYDTSYADPQSADNELVQYAQSSSEMKPLLHEVRRVVRQNEGTDVLFYGDHPDFDGDELHAPDPESHSTPPAGAGWFERLPFAWYLEAYGAETASTDDAEAVEERVQADRPPVVITFGPSETCSEEYDNAEDIQQYMDGYERHEVDRFLHDSGCIVSSVVVYVDEDAASGQDGSGSLARPTTADGAAPSDAAAVTSPRAVRVAPTGPEP